MLSLSVSSCSSVALAGRPHTCCSLRPLTGLGALGLGNQRRMLQVRQLGPPPTNKSSPAAAREHRWFQLGGGAVVWWSRWGWLGPQQRVEALVHWEVV